jgi:hypothetical protein
MKRPQTGFVVEREKEYGTPKHRKNKYRYAAKEPQ